MRKKLLFRNTASSLIYQLANIICTFILPRLILSVYGSQVNGLVNSITDFLQIISLLELGVGAVVQSSLYKPLAERNNDKISQIVTSSGKFFTKIGQILLVYVVVLMALYPILVKKEFGHLYSATLIAAMSISFFARYYFGITDRLLLNADQRGYISYNAQTVTLIANTVVCAVMIKLGGSIHMVKLTTSLIFLLRPLYLRICVNRRYAINRKAVYDEEPIEQKWNGIAQHIASVVLDYTDNIVLTAFATLQDVSVYSVYHLVTFGTKSIFISMSNGLKSLFGEMWAKEEKEDLKNFFSFCEWIIHTASTYVFSVLGLIIIPFVRIYTAGANDATAVNYANIPFAVLIVLAQFGHTIRIPYHLMIGATGHYKQTQNNYIIAATMNVVISIITVKSFGLVGVAIGTLSAMLYQTIWMAWYNSRNLLNISMKLFVKQIVVDIISLVACAGINLFYSIQASNYLQLVVNAMAVVVICAVIVIIINIIMYFKNIKKSVGILIKKFR